MAHARRAAAQVGAAVDPSGCPSSDNTLFTLVHASPTIAPEVGIQVNPSGGASMSDDIVPEADLPVDLPVYTQDGHHLGTVKEVFEQAFKVAAPMRPDYWLRTEAIASVADGRYT